jgi:hypothetical protein
MKIIYCIFTLSVLATSHLSAEQNDELSRIKSLVGDIETKTRAQGINRPDVLVDTLPEVCSRPEFRALQDALKNDWPVAIANLDEVAKDDLAKTIVLCSSWYLSEDDFAILLGEVASRVEMGNLNRDVFRWCQWPFESPLDGFLIRNYSNTDVRNIIIRSRTIFKDQPDSVATYDRILSGEALRELKRFEAAIGGKRFSCSKPKQSSVSAEKGSATAKSPAKPNRRFVLPATIGILAVLACVGVWKSRGHK